MAPTEQAPVDAVDNSYVVVLVAKGGARLQPGEGLQLNQLNTDAGPPASSCPPGTRRSGYRTDSRRN